jgi:ATP-dependent RNA/DNA helicase IGHMBP2
MEKTLKDVMRAERGRLAELRDVLYGVKAPRFERNNTEVSSHLNPSQQAAVAHILKAKDVAVVHGPPGTGKTTTLTEAIRLTLQTEKQVLVCAPSNTAVDLLTEKLSALGLNVLRIGNPARVSEDLLRHTAEAQVARHRDYALIKQLRRSATEYNQMARKYKRNFGKAEREQRKMLLAEARKLSREAEDIERYITDSLVAEAQVVTCTPVGSTNRLLGDLEFSTVFIDEAAQALEPAAWIPIRRAKRVVFAGDPFQLPATVKSYEAGKRGLSVSLMENVIKLEGVSVMLETQYRMHKQIMEFSNRQFYGGRLEAHSSVAEALLGTEDPLSQPVTFIDTAGTGYEEKTDPESSSTYNPGEADLLLQYLVHVVEQISITEPALLQQKGSIGIISPYKAQVEYLAQHLKENEMLMPYEKAFSLGTVDGFQGQEREVICISLVRSNESGEIGFLEDTRRTNVALTRAKRKLVVIGDSATLSNSTFYNHMLAYFEEINSYKSAWEFMY